MVAGRFNALQFLELTLPKPPVEAPVAPVSAPSAHIAAALWPIAAHVAAD
jgi:hypothetical protein